MVYTIYIGNEVLEHRTLRQTKAFVDSVMDAKQGRTIMIKLQANNEIAFITLKNKHALIIGRKNV